MVVWILTQQAHAGECEPRELLLQALESAPSQETMTRFTLALGCGGPAEPAQLARMWLCEAVLARARSDEAGVEDALSAALQLSPELATTGPEPWRAELLALVGAPQGVGSLSVDPPGAVAVLDGQLLSGGLPPPWPRETPSGLHLLQAGPSSTALEAAMVVYLAPNVDLVVTLPVHLPAPVVEPAAKRPAGRKVRDFALLATTVATGTGGLVSATLARDQNRVMRAATTHETLDGAFHTQQVLGVAAYGLIGASLTSTLLLVVLK